MRSILTKYVRCHRERRRGSGGHGSRFRPRLEALEERATPSVYTVDRLTDLGEGAGLTGDLRYCITQANAASGDDVIDFQPGLTGTINLTGALPDLNSNLAIQGPGAGSLTVRRNTGGNYRIFTVPGGRTVALSGLTIANGAASSSGGGGISNQGTLTVSNSTLSGNDAFPGVGGGIRNDGTLTVSNSTLSGNDAAAGGGIFTFGSGALTTVSNS